MSYKEIEKGTQCKIYSSVVPYGANRPNVDLVGFRALAQKCDGIYIFNGGPNGIAESVE